MNIQKLTILDSARIVNELNGICPLRIRKASRADSNRAVYFEQSGEDKNIVYRNDGKSAFIGQTLKSSDSAREFTPLLRECRIGKFAQANNDRIIIGEIEKTDRLGRVINYRLLFELMPKKGNCYVLGSDNEIKAMLSPGDRTEYIFPKAISKPSVLTIANELREGSEINIDDLMSNYVGLCPIDLRNIKRQFPNTALIPVASVLEYLNKAMNIGPAFLIFGGGNVAGYSLLDPALEEGESAKKFDSLLEALEQYHESISNKRSYSENSDRLAAILRAAMTKSEKKIRTIEEEIQKYQDGELYKRYGDLILANLNNLPERGFGLKLMDHLSGQNNEIEIALDPSKSIRANATAFFRKYKKAAQALKLLTERLQKARGENRNLMMIKESNSDNPEKLNEELRRLGLVKETSGKSKRPEKKKPFRQFKSSNGWEILVGKNDADNDELTFHIASKHDYWFHAWQAAGSHTVLRLPDKNAIPEKHILEEAAAVAAYFSKARHSSKVPVAYTTVKFVHKPRKFPPGKVLVEKEKQLMVKPFIPKEQIRD